MDFGTNDMIWIWPDGDGTPIILYESFEGKEFLYRAKKSIRFAAFQRLISPERGNSTREE